MPASPPRTMAPIRKPTNCAPPAAPPCARNTRRVGTKDCSPVPLTEPDVRFTHPAPWIAMSDFQRELVRDLRRVEVVPQGFERGHPAGEPARWVSSRHRPQTGRDKTQALVHHTLHLPGHDSVLQLLPMWPV